MENAKGLLIATAFLTGSLMTATECVARRLAGSKSAADAQTLGAGLTAEKMNECRWLLCRIRHSSHNVECRTMPDAFGARRRLARKSSGTFLRLSQSTAQPAYSSRLIATSRTARPARLG